MKEIQNKLLLKSVHYLNFEQIDELFGLTVTTVGYQSINPNEKYPPPITHPSGYHLDVQEGRIINEFQLLYITEGRGTLIIDGTKEFAITEGKMFLLFPGIRHSYFPLENTGWNEYWIGFKGQMMNNLVQNGFFNSENPVLNIGMNERIVDLYIKAIDIVNENRNFRQQALSGIVINMLGLSYYRDKTSNFIDEVEVEKINKAKVIMRKSIYCDIQLEEIANQLNISYSLFRKLFKKISGVSPANYFQELRLKEAKLLLTTSHFSAKEISYVLNYENPEYFSAFFKKKTGKTPGEYRVLR